MGNLKGTRTEKNLLASFAGESQARNRYTYFASAAKKAGYEQIAAIFLETADNEKEHAKRFFKFLEGGDVEISATYPAGVIDDTVKNLEASAAGEHLEWTKLYKEAGDIAREEGFEEVAVQFEEIAKVETEHERRYLKLLANINEDKAFKRGKVVKGKCRNCGRVIEADEAPDECPTCKHPRAYFELKLENY